MVSRFHLAIPAGDLTAALAFYCDLLGCRKGNSEENGADSWVDIDFWGHELTLHASDPDERLAGRRHDVDMGNVSVPHFGVHLDADVFAALKQRLTDREVAFVDKPYKRFAGTGLEQETFFVADPNGNVLEIKTMKHPTRLFADAGAAHAGV